MQAPKEGAISVVGLLVRVYWMFVSNAAMVFLLAFILQKHAGFPSGFDLAYWLVAASQLAVRYLDIRYLDGETAIGEPATLRHWRRHALIVIFLALAGWIVARVIEQHLR